VEGGKPLFALLLHREPGGPGWVGWSPGGPYDASGDAAEARIGWLTNTGNPAAPVEFVAAGEHRKQYYRRGILGLLAEEADLGLALKRDAALRAPPEPALQPRRPDAALVTKQDDVFLIHEAVPALRVGVNADYPLTGDHVLKWSVRRTDGGNVTEAEAEATGTAKRDGDEWEAELKRVRWRRGEYRVQFFLHPDKDAQSIAAAALTLRFQPPAPTLALQLDGKDVDTTEAKPLTVMDDKLTLQVVLGAAKGQKVEVSFGQRVNGVEKDAPKPLTVEAGKHAQVFTLAKGLNRLLIRAVNADALPGHEADEAAAAEVWVRYNAPVELPPRFTMLKLDRTPETKEIDKKDVWVVDQPRVRLEGRIEADGVLVQADWSKGTADALSVLPERGAGKVLEFHVELELKAGDVVPLRLRAKSKNSDVQTADLSVVFHPPLPVLAADPLDRPDRLDAKLILTGTFRAAPPHPFKLTVRVTPEQGPAKDFQAEVDAEKKTWQAALTLTPGRNQVEALVRNDWRGEEPAAAVNLTLRYRRPPRIVEAKDVTAVETAVVDLPLTVESPAKMPLRLITIDGHAFRSFRAIPGPEKEGWVTWQVVVPRVPVCDNGRKLERLKVLAHNEDGPYGTGVLVRETVVTVTHKVVPKAADVRILLDGPVNETKARRGVPFRIVSDSRLTSVEIHRDDEVIYKADLQKGRQEGKRFVLEDEPQVPLNVGTNDLKLVAFNDGGSADGRVVVNRVPPSVRVEIDQIELRPDKDAVKVLEKKTGADGEITFAAAPGSLVWVVGHVTWTDLEAKQLDAPDLNVVLLVSGFVQFPVALGPRGKEGQAGVRAFEAPVVLTAAQNTIKVEVRQGRGDAGETVGQQALSRNEFTLDCAAPATDQRLHLLVVGVNVADGKALAQRVLDTLGAEAKDRPSGLQGEFKTGAFKRCILYRVLTGEVERGKVEAQLVEINKEVGRLSRENKGPNDVILIYYQGEDLMKGGERWLKTSRNLQYPDAAPETYAIPCRALPRVAGAQLLLLNVLAQAQTRAAGPGWGGDPNMGLLHYASLNRQAAVMQQLGRAVLTEKSLGAVAKNVEDWAGKQREPVDVRNVLATGQASIKIGPPQK
jgi:hypothetical protein